MYDSAVTQQEEIHRGHATIISTHQQRQGIAAAEDPTNEELLASGAVRQYLETTEGRRRYAQYINATEQTNMIGRTPKIRENMQGKKQKIPVIEQLAVSNSTVLNQELNWGSIDWNKEAELIKSLLSQTNKCND